MIPQGFRRAPRSASTDLAFFLTAALAGSALAVIASISPYVAAVLLVVGP